MSEAEVEMTMKTVRHTPAQGKGFASEGLWTSRATMEALPRWSDRAVISYLALYQVLPETRPSLDTMSRDLVMPIGTIRDALDSLCRAGWVLRETRPGLPSRYTLSPKGIALTRRTQLKSSSDPAEIQRTTQRKSSAPTQLKSSCERNEALREREEENDDDDERASRPASEARDSQPAPSPAASPSSSSPRTSPPGDPSRPATPSSAATPSPRAAAPSARPVRSTIRRDTLLARLAHDFGDRAAQALTLLESGTVRYQRFTSPLGPQNVGGKCWPAMVTHLRAHLDAEPHYQAIEEWRQFDPSEYVIRPGELDDRYIAAIRAITAAGLPLKRAS